VDIRRGHGDAREKRVEGHTVIAFRMVMRHETLVAPEPVHTVPRKTRRDFGCSEKLVKTPRRRSARQAHCKIAIACARKRAKPFGGVARKRFGILEHATAGTGADACDGRGIVRRAENRRSGDDRIRAGGDGDAGAFAILAAVHLDPRVQSLRLA
jgi:hypothetical protein